MWSKGGDSDVEAMSMWAQERPIGIDVDMGGDGDVEEETASNRSKDCRVTMRETTSQRV